ncbi:hypothetical protein BKA70DRAFT_1565258 [Coprinopsis sp. MPI-PUGE-AT-0042]|nr:hypothetical protein BKA70DRAFT_1565258 [Coprinopsis sp. MPI-PUGE-AT-0042]
MNTVGVNISLVNMQYSSIVDPLHCSYLPPLPMCSAYDVQDAYHMSPVSPYSDAVLSPLASPSSSASTPPSSPSPPPSQSRKRKPKKIRTTIPRPPNAFILFRSDFWAHEKQKIDPIERNHRGISRIAGHCWRNLDAISKQYYHERAFQLRELHRQQYPEYKFKPASKKAREANKPLPSEDDERCRNLASTLMPELLAAAWEREATDSYAAASEPLHEVLVLPPTVDLLWDDPFGLSMTSFESMTHEAFGCGFQEQPHLWGFDELTMSLKHTLLDRPPICPPTFSFPSPA